MNPALMMLMRAGASFDVASLSGLKLWLDASDASTITQSGGLVSLWADKSGRAFHVSQAADARKPTYDATKLGGRGAVYFGASAQRALQSATVSGLVNTSSLTVHAVIVRRGNLLSYSAIIGQMQPTPAVGSGFGLNFATANSGGLGTDAFMPTGTTSGASGAIALDAPKVVTVTVSPLSDIRLAASTRLRVGGTELTPTTYGSATTISMTSAILTVGNWVPSRVDMGWPGDICELIVRSAAATTSEITATEQYLATKWGIA